MEDYLHETTPAGRRLGFVLAAGAALVSWAIFLVPVSRIVTGGMTPGNHLTLVVMLVLFGLLGLYCTNLAVRLATGRRTGNGLTTMPPWTTQVFGAFLLVGMAFAAVRGQDALFAIEGIPLAGAMILVGRNLARRERRRRARETATGTIPPANASGSG